MYTFAVKLVQARQSSLKTCLSALLTRHKQKKDNRLTTRQSLHPLTSTHKRYHSQHKLKLKQLKMQFSKSQIVEERTHSSLYTQDNPTTSSSTMRICPYLINSARNYQMSYSGSYCSSKVVMIDKSSPSSKLITCK